jgi:hypothetical protein
MLALILWLPFLGFLGGSYICKGVVLFTPSNIFLICCISTFLLYQNSFMDQILLLLLNFWAVCGSLNAIKKI